MQRKQLPWLSSVFAIAQKDALTEFRSRYALSSLVMFAIITLSAISMSIGGFGLTPAIAAVLLWITIYFSAMAGLARGFVQEQEAGTLVTLRIYAKAQAVLFGKFLFNIILMLVLLLILVPLFVLFLNIEVFYWGHFISVLALGSIGISIISTMTASMVAQTQGRGSLLSVLTFPLLLPAFLMVLQMTERILAGYSPDWQNLIFLMGYDVVMIIASSILFDYLWYE